MIHPVEESANGIAGWPADFNIRQAVQQFPEERGELLPRQLIAQAVVDTSTSEAHVRVGVP